MAAPNQVQYGNGGSIGGPFTAHVGSTFTAEPFVEILLPLATGAMGEHDRADFSARAILAIEILCLARAHSRHCRNRSHRSYFHHGDCLSRRGRQLIGRLPPAFGAQFRS